MWLIKINIKIKKKLKLNILLNTLLTYFCENIAVLLYCCIQDKYARTPCAAYKALLPTRWWSRIVPLRFLTGQNVLTQ